MKLGSWWQNIKVTFLRDTSEKAWNLTRVTYPIILFTKRQLFGGSSRVRLSMSLSCSRAFTFDCFTSKMQPSVYREPLGIIPGTNEALSDASAFAMRRNKPWTRWEVVWWMGFAFFCCIWFCRPSSTKNQVSMYNVSIWMFHVTFYCNVP